jgi:hypothetical protein
VKQNWCVLNKIPSPGKVDFEQPPSSPHKPVDVTILMTMPFGNVREKKNFIWLNQFFQVCLGNRL